MNGSLFNEAFVKHLIELRDRLLRIILLILILLISLFPFANTLYTFVANPLMAVLPHDTSMIATQVASPFLTPFKLSLVTALFLAMPYVLYQIWAFITPGLYQKEQRLAKPILISSILLFYLGTLFAYFIVFPLIFTFLTSTAPQGVTVMTDISHYLDFVLALFFAFGLSFEVPIAIILLVQMGITTPEALVRKRPYMIVGAFVVGMLLTPPDVISQTLLAIPVWLLYEIGILVARLLNKATIRHPTTKITSETVTKHAKTLQTSPQNTADNSPTNPTVSNNHPQPSILTKIQQLRAQERYTEARTLLYELLTNGNEDQQQVAKNILAQLDDTHV